MTEETKNKPDIPQEDTSQDASVKEVLFYAFGNIENGIANQFFVILKQIMIVTMFINPLLIGLVISIKTIWDSITDPIMAYITDNTRTRWGRRRPYILFGGVLRIALLLLIVIYFPHSDNMLSNAYLETDKSVSKANAQISEATDLLMRAYEGEEGLSDTTVSKKAKEFGEWFVEITNKVPATISVLQINRQQKLDWIANIDTNKPYGQRMVVKLSNVLKDVDKRLEKTSNIVVQVQQLKTLRDVVTTRLNGTSDPRLEKEATRVSEIIKLEKIEPLIPQMEDALEKWALLNEWFEQMDKQEGFGFALAFLLKDNEIRRRLEHAHKQTEDAHELLASMKEMKQHGQDVLAHLQGETETEIEPLAYQDVFSTAVKASRVVMPKMEKPKKKSTIREGWQSFKDPANRDQQRVIWFLLVSFLLFTTLTTIQSVPYYALGIELCPSYDGRTRVAVCRSVIDKLIGGLAPWVPFFCFLPMFQDAFEGLFYIAVLATCIGIPSTVLMCVFIRERTYITRKKRMGFLKSIGATLQNPNFWRVFFIYQAIGLTWGIFMQFGTYLNIYWVMGSAVKGAGLSAIVQMLAWGLTFAVLPLVNWGCRRYQKHRVVQVAVILMGIGAVLQWWAVNPNYPYMQLVLPFFTSVGISSFYIVMGTLLADVTDDDELRTGERREGMFAAVMSFVGKMVGAVTPIIAGGMLVVSGFDATLEYNQTSRTILNMRMLYSFVPGVLLLIATILLWNYPLTRKRMQEIKAELKRRHEADQDAKAEEKGKAVDKDGEKDDAKPEAK